MNNVFVMCGLPGIGKSTWIKNFKADNKIVISRDEIRFSMLEKDEDYFSREPDVFNEFIRQIRKALINGKNENIFIDATHLNRASRRKLLNSIGQNLLTENHIIAVSFPNDLDKALKQNELRKGQGRSYVPRGVIRRMHEQFQCPDVSEGFDTIMEVDLNE